MIIVSLLLIVLAVFGAPLFVIIATSAMVGFQSNDTELMTIALELLSISQMPVLTAIPLFTFAGYLLSESKAPARLVRLTSAMFGWMPGGLALVLLRWARFCTRHLNRTAIAIDSTSAWSPRQVASACCSLRHCRSSCMASWPRSVSTTCFAPAFFRAW